MQRLRLELSEVLLTPACRQQGLSRCWFWPSTAAVTIADFTREIYTLLCLDCSGGPAGLRLVLDGFTLPPGGPVGLLRDGDLITVRKLPQPQTLQLQAAITCDVVVPNAGTGAVVAIEAGGGGDSGDGPGDGRVGRKRKRRSAAGAPAAGGVGGGGGTVGAAAPNVGDDPGYQEQEEDPTVQQHQQPMAKARRLAAFPVADANAAPTSDGHGMGIGEETGLGLFSTGGDWTAGGDGAAAAAEGGLDVAPEGGRQAGAEKVAGEEKKRSRSARRKSLKRQFRRMGMLPYTGPSGGAGSGPVGSVSRQLRPARQKEGLAQRAVEKKVQQQQQQKQLKKQEQQEQEQQVNKQEQVRSQRAGQTSAMVAAALAASPLDPNGTLPGAVGLHPQYSYYATSSGAADADGPAAAFSAGEAAKLAQKPAQPRLLQQQEQQQQSQKNQGPSATASRGVADARGNDGYSAGAGPPSGTNVPKATAVAAAAVGRAGSQQQGLNNFRCRGGDTGSGSSDDDDSDSRGGTVRKPPATAAVPPPSRGRGSAATQAADGSASTSSEDSSSSEDESGEADGDGGGAATVTKAATTTASTDTDSRDSDGERSSGHSSSSSSSSSSSESSSESSSSHDETSSEEEEEEEKEAVEKEEVKDATPAPRAVSGSLPVASSKASAVDGAAAGLRQAAGTAPLMDNDRLPPFNRSAVVGDVLVYKLLEIGLDMCPRVSEWRQARVTSVDEGTGAVVLEPHPDPRVHPLQGELDVLRARLEAEAASGSDGDADGTAGEGHAFELDWAALPFPTDYDQDGRITLTLNQMADVRALSTAAAEAAPGPATPPPATAPAAGRPGPATWGANLVSTPRPVAAAGLAAVAAPGSEGAKRPATRALVMASAAEAPRRPWALPPPSPMAQPSAGRDPHGPSRGAVSRPATPRAVWGAPTASAKRPLPQQQQHQAPMPSGQCSRALVVTPTKMATAGGPTSASAPGALSAPPPGSIVAAVGGWAAIAEELRQKRLELGTCAARPPGAQAPGSSAHGHKHHHHHQQQQQQQQQQGPGRAVRASGPAGKSGIPGAHAAAAGRDGPVSQRIQLPVPEVKVPGFNNEAPAPKSNTRAGSGSADMAYHGDRGQQEGLKGLGLENGAHVRESSSGGMDKAGPGPGGGAACAQTPGAVRPRGGARRVAIGPMLSYLRSSGGL